MIQLKRYANKRKTLLVLGLVFLSANLLSVLSPLTPAANAAPVTDAEKQACFSKYNGVNVQSMSALDQAKYRDDCLGYCQPQAGNDSIISCPDPSAAATAEAFEAEVAPLLKLACDVRPQGGAGVPIYDKCIDQVRDIYISCSDTGHPGATQFPPSDTAACAVPRINALPPVNKINVNGAITAITAGRGAAEAVTTAAANAAAKKACEDQGGTFTDGKCTPKAEEKSCSGGALGWIICPIIGAIGGVNDAIFYMIEQQLFINPVSVQYNGPLYKIWTTFRDIANVSFVIAFIVVIYSQATGAGLSSYGVKKMLPRIIVTAILVNISFFLCQIALDVSNIVGKSLGDLMESILGGANVNVDIISWDSLITLLIAGGAVFGVGSAVVAAGGVAAAAALLLPFAVTAMFAALTAIVVLIARQAIIILLIAIAPLAFVAYLLPNTSKYFERWRELFTTMLVLYPLVAMLFAGSKLASWILLNAGTNGAEVSPLMMLTAIMILFLPLFGVPLLLKFSGGLLGRIGAFVNNPNKGPFDQLKKRAEGYAKFQKDNATERNLMSKKPRRSGLGFIAATRRDAKRDALYNSADRRSKEATTHFIGKKLEPGEDGVSADPKLAGRMAGAGKFSAVDKSLKRQVSADELTRVTSLGLQAAEELDIKNLKAAQVVLQNARVNGDNLQKLQEGGDAVGMTGQTIKGSSTMQLAAAEMMMSQGRQMDDVVRNMAQSDKKGVRSFAVGLIQSNYSTAKQKQIGLIDEGFMAQVASGELNNEAKYNAALEQSTINNATKLTPTLAATQEASSSGRLVNALNNNDNKLVTSGGKDITQQVVQVAHLSLDNQQTRSAMPEGTAKALEAMRDRVPLASGDTTVNQTVNQTVNNPTGELRINRDTPGGITTPAGLYLSPQAVRDIEATAPTPPPQGPYGPVPPPAGTVPPPARPTPENLRPTPPPAARPADYTSGGAQIPGSVTPDQAEEYRRRMGL